MLAWGLPARGGPEGAAGASPDVVDARTPSVFARVATCLSHPSWEVRRLASEILGQDRSPAARDLLRARRDLELEPVGREALTEALAIRPPRFDGGG